MPERWLASAQFLVIGPESYKIFILCALILATELDFGLHKTAYRGLEVFFHYFFPLNVNNKEQQKLLKKTAEVKLEFFPLFFFI